MNSVNLIGRLTADPVKRATPNGNDVCTMRLAIERAREGADYVDVTAFGKLRPAPPSSGRCGYRTIARLGERLLSAVA
jgi:Single-strand binding protein family